MKESNQNWIVGRASLEKYLAQIESSCLVCI